MVGSLVETTIIPFTWKRGSEPTKKQKKQTKHVNTGAEMKSLAKINKNRDQNRNRHRYK